MIALMYCIINNVKTFALFMLDASTYLVLNNLSVLTTALLYRIVFRRPFSGYQVVALILLVTGLFVSKISVMTTGTHHHMQPSHPGQGVPRSGEGRTVLLQGVLLMVVGSLLASAADVFNEFAFKDVRTVDEPFIGQSIAMYGAGVFFNFCSFFVWNRNMLGEEYARIMHMNMPIFAMLLLSSVGGISIGICFRFTRGGNLNKIFADGAALLLTLFCSFVLLVRKKGGWSLVCVCRLTHVLVFFQGRFSIFGAYSGPCSYLLCSLHLFQRGIHQEARHCC